MIDNKKSTDPGLSASERKTLRDTKHRRPIPVRAYFVELFQGGFVALKGNCPERNALYRSIS
jgi:hypothetical protein